MKFSLQVDELASDARFPLQDFLLPSSHYLLKQQLDHMESVAAKDQSKGSGSKNEKADEGWKSAMMKYCIATRTRLSACAVPQHIAEGR